MGSPAYVQRRDKTEEADRELVVKALEGDQEAFESIVRTYQRRVYAVTLRMTRQHHVADEITQETFVRAYTRLQSFELGRPLAPWLTRIAVNLSINHLTGRVKREQPLEDDMPVDRLKTADDKSPDPLESLISSEFAHALVSAVEKLPLEQKAVFILRVQEEMRYDEIAESLGISSGTVMSRLHRARSKLKEMLRDYI